MWIALPGLVSTGDANWSCFSLSVIQSGISCVTRKQRVVLILGQSQRGVMPVKLW